MKNSFTILNIEERLNEKNVFFSFNFIYFDSWKLLWTNFGIGLMITVFANGTVDWGSIPGRVIPKTQKWDLMPLCLTLSIIR